MLEAKQLDFDYEFSRTKKAYNQGIRTKHNKQRVNISIDADLWNSLEVKNKSALIEELIRKAKEEGDLDFPL